MTLTQAKQIADDPNGRDHATLRAALERLSQTMGNGGVRNSERATSKLLRRIAALETALCATENRPLAAPGLTSYRYRSRYGWVMIGAKDHADALNEALRSCGEPNPENLQIWNGTEYVPAITDAHCAPQESAMRRARTA